jgi:hypothetical protein
VFITPIAFTNIGYRTWIIFAATNFAIVPLVYFFFPETAFRSLEEVDVIFFLANEAPGNPWLNAVRISLHEPLWFGKKGENRIGFDYANSSWHRKLTETTSSGSGSASGSNEKRGRKDKDSGSSGSDTVAPQLPTPKKRPGSESPVDPFLFRQDHSSSGTMTTTLASHKNDSKRSLRNTLTRSESSEQRLTIEQQNHTHHNVVPLPSSSEPLGNLPTLVPTPAHYSNPPSERNRPYSSDSATHRAFHYPDHVGQQVVTDEDARPSVEYPGRLDTKRTESGEETYWPDGMERQEESRPRRSRGSDKARSARDAGRAY